MAAEYADAEAAPAESRHDKAALRGLVPALAAGTVPAGVPNQAVASALLGAMEAVSAQQAPTAAPVGLATSQRIDDYVAAVRSYADHSMLRHMPLSRLALHALRVANDHLTAIGVPRVTGNLVEGASFEGHFSRTDWTITINWASFVGDNAPEDTGEPPIAAVPSAELAALAGTVYHEARHAEQHFRMARLVAGRHAERLRPPLGGLEEDDSLLAVIQRAWQAVQTREEVLGQLAEEQGIPLAVMRAAAERPLAALPSEGDPLIQRLGTLALGLRELTVADLLRPTSALAQAQAAGQRKIAVHAQKVEETEAWHDNRKLNQMVSELMAALDEVLPEFVNEVAKAGTANFDQGLLESGRDYLDTVLQRIDEEQPRFDGGSEMHEALDGLRDVVMNVHDEVHYILFLLEDDEPDRAYIAQVARQVPPELQQLRRSVHRAYHALLREIDARAKDERVKATWER